MQVLESRVDLTRRPKAKPMRPAGPALPPIVRSLVLAHQIDRVIADGRARSFGEVARQLGVTQPRITQIMKLRGLAPSIQERILLGGPEIARLSEPKLRVVTQETDWEAQVVRLDTLLDRHASAVSLGVGD